MNPRVRGQSLPDNIDFDRSLQIAVSHQWASRVEKTFHYVARAFAIAEPHRLDGSTEWFADNALPVLIDFSQRNPELFLGSFTALDALPVKSHLKRDAFLDDLYPIDLDIERKISEFTEFINTLCSEHLTIIRRTQNGAADVWHDNAYRDIRSQLEYFMHQRTTLRGRYWGSYAFITGYSHTQATQFLSFGVQSLLSPFNTSEHEDQTINRVRLIFACLPIANDD